MTAHNGFDVRRRRQREIETIARYLGVADTDDFGRFLVAWLQARPAPGDRVFAVQNAAIRMGGRISMDAKARALVEEARTTPRPGKPDAWAIALRLTYEQRQALGITTIGAIDVRQNQREELRKQRRRQADERRRRARGAKPQSRSLSRTKPWKAAGMSRASWYRQCRRKPQVIAPAEVGRRVAGGGTKALARTTERKLQADLQGQGRGRQLKRPKKKPWPMTATGAQQRHIALGRR